MTNLLTLPACPGGRNPQPLGAHHGPAICQQLPEEVHAQLDRVTDQLGDRFPQAASVPTEAGRRNVVAKEQLPAVELPRSGNRLG